MKRFNHFTVRGKELFYQGNIKVRPFYIRIILILFNKLGTRINVKIRNFSKSFFKTLRLKGYFNILNKKVSFYLYSSVSELIYHAGLPSELRISENLLRLTPPQSIFYDIGTSMGLYSLLLSDKCQEIIGFDPYDDSSLINTRLNRMNNFKLYPYFLSNYEKSGETIVTSIDNLIQRGFPLPNVIKIDVEEEEYNALLGASNLFNTNPPKIVLIETHTKELFYKCLDFFKPLNYRLYNLGCPKINTGGDIYSLAYDLKTDIFNISSESRTILAIRS